MISFEQVMDVVTKERPCPSLNIVVWVPTQINRSTSKGKLLLEHHPKHQLFGICFSCEGVKTL